MESVTGMKWNHWPGSNGMGGRNGMESVAGIKWNMHQNTVRQLDGVDLYKVFTEKVSAKDMNRPQLKACMKLLRSGDTLHCHSIDRLARNLMDLQKIVNSLVSKKISVKFHKEKLLFCGDDDPMSVMMLQMMGAFSQFECALINERREEGVALAKLAGTKFGRKVKLSDEQVKEIRRRVDDGAEKKALAEEFGISRGTIYNVLK